MKILVLTGLYPPHHAGTEDYRCQGITETLAKRGHLVRVLTSNHGVGAEQRDAEVERRLLLNGAFEHPLVSSYSDLSRLERRNHAVLRESLADFQPEVVYVWSLQGLSKSLIYALQRCGVPTVYAVVDDWLERGVRQDPWLRWWNQLAPPALSALWRALLETSGRRNRLDVATPTRMTAGYNRIPEVYGPPAALAAVQPNSVGAFRFDRVYFCSYLLKGRAERAGFQVQQAEVIYPGIRVEPFASPAHPQSAPAKKFLIVTELEPESGVMTALEAWRFLRQSRIAASLSIYGSGQSDYIAKLRSFVVTHQLPVEFLTLSTTQRDLVAIYRQHDAFLYTPELDEAFATAPLEAIASGLPVICARAGGIHEVLRQRETAFTYATGNAAELAQRVQELQIQPALRCQVVENAQQLVFAELNESAMVDRVERFLETSRQLWQAG